VTVRVASGRAQLACDIDAPDRGPAPDVLYLHADVADRRVWPRLWERLGPGQRAVAFDRRGFGETEYTPEPYADVDDAVAVLDAARVGRAVVVGNSGGGRLALDLALAHPERVAALVLVAPAVRGAPGVEDADLPPAVRRLSEAIDLADEAGDLATVNRLEAHVWLDGPEQDEGRVGGVARDLFLDMNGRALAAPEPGTQPDRPSAWDRLGDIGVPTLVVAGDLDVPHVRDRAAAVAGRVPGARFVTLAGVAHVPMLEDRPELADELAAFLAATGRA
jgi:pimeloyl-ACP methyl ester carboxylesterase